MLNFFRGHVERLCALAVIGELTPGETTRMETHLRSCDRCQEFYEDLIKISSLDLPLKTAVDVQYEIASDLDLECESVLSKIMARTRSIQVPRSAGLYKSVPSGFASYILQLFGRFYAPAGWAFATLLLIAWGVAAHRAPSNIQSRDERPTLASAAAPLQIVAQLQARVTELEKEKNAMGVELDASKARATSAQQSLETSNLQISHLETSQRLLENQLEADAGHVREISGNLSNTETDLEHEREKSSDLLQQLAEVNAKFDRQKTEVAHLRDVAATTTTHLPMLTNDIDAADALEIVRARDLHIVDVYDVDHGGNSAKSYGRVYYVNQRLLLFYAFDLANNSRKSRKTVAFQAWGMDQEKPNTPRSLGLFFLDDSKLDRWVLRVSDPKILSHVETLFVTVEPPGGSAAPKGRQLLFASLAGPPNHP